VRESITFLATSMEEIGGRGKSKNFTIDVSLTERMGAMLVALRKKVRLPSSGGRRPSTARGRGKRVKVVGGLRDIQKTRHRSTGKGGLEGKKTRKSLEREGNAPGARTEPS